MKNLTLLEEFQSGSLESIEDYKVRQLLTLAILTGSTMLKNGAETYRVEDTIKRICKSRPNIRFAHSFVIPSALFVAIDYEGELISYLKRVSPEQMNLNKIHLVNEFSRKFVNSDMSVSDGLKRIKEIDRSKTYSQNQLCLFAGIISATFTGLFGGNAIDSQISGIVGLVTMKFIFYIYKMEFISFIDNFLAGFIGAFLSYMAKKIGLAHDMDVIIIGVIMPLLPGYALTNSIRDAISGDHVSSLSRGLDAILSGVAMALGVATVLKFI